MKNKCFKRLIISVLVLGCPLLFSSCVAGNNFGPSGEVKTSSKTSTTSTPVAVSSQASSGYNGNGKGGDEYYSPSNLSTVESYVYSSIIGSISSFKDPSSVKVVSVCTETLIGRYIKLSAKNSYGGTVTKIYRCSGYGLTEAELNNYEADYSISVSSINNALDNYKRSQGWL